MSQFLRKNRRISFLTTLLLLVTFSVTAFIFPITAAADPNFTGKADTVQAPVNKGKAKRDVIIAPPDDLPKKPGTTRIEIPSQRTEYSQRFLNPDGTFTEEISAEPKFYKDKGKWIPIENDIISSLDGLFKYKNKANKFNTYFGANGNVRYETKDGWLEFKPIGASTNLDLKQSNKIKYFKPFEGTDIEYTIENTRMKEEIILSNYTGKNIFTFDVTTNNLTVKANQETGLLTLYNKKNQPIAQFDAPFMTDASGARSNNVTLQFTKQDGKDVLVLAADANWLSDTNRQFPVVIDPTISYWNVAKDTFIASGAPTTNYSSATYLSSGKDATLNTTRSFAQFNLPTLPTGAEITSAKVGFYQTVNDGASVTMDVYRVTSYWSAPVTTWNNSPNTAATAEYSVTSSSYNLYWYFYITQLIKEWYSMGATTPNYGAC